MCIFTKAVLASTNTNIKYVGKNQGMFCYEGEEDFQFYVRGSNVCDLDKHYENHGTLGMIRINYSSVMSIPSIIVVDNDVYNIIPDYKGNEIATAGVMRDTFVWYRRNEDDVCGPYPCYTVRSNPFPLVEEELELTM